MRDLSTYVNGIAAGGCLYAVGTVTASPTITYLGLGCSTVMALVAVSETIRKWRQGVK